MIGLIGFIDSEAETFGGQAVKTRTIYQMLVERYGMGSVRCVDTKGYGRHPLRTLLRFFGCIRECEAVIVSLSRNGCRMLFPLLAWASRTRGTKVFHCLIGGTMDRLVKEHPSWLKYMSTFEVNWVEFRQLKESLKEMGVANVEYMPNFKKLPSISDGDLCLPSGPEFRFCTFSRVMREKGVSDAIDAVVALRRKGVPASLDIYGEVDREYREEFESKVASDELIRYCGAIDPSESVETIRGYYALLFPTYWIGEGMPGTVIDALSAGLPVVASRWRYYDEMLEDGVTGYSYDYGKQELLVSAIEKMIEASPRLIQIKRSCLARSREYAAEAVFERMAGRIEKACPSVMGC